MIALLPLRRLAASHSPAKLFFPAELGTPGRFLANTEYWPQSGCFLNAGTRSLKWSSNRFSPVDSSRDFRLRAGPPIDGDLPATVVCKAGSEGDARGSPVGMNATLHEGRATVTGPHVNLACAGGTSRRSCICSSACWLGELRSVARYD